VPSFETSGAEVEFLVKVQTSRDVQSAYSVRRRFSQFEALHKLLKAGFNGIPSFPKTGSVKDQAAIEKRREALAGYLKSLVSDGALVKTPEVRAFLELTAAEHLFRVLREKDEFDATNLALKDEALAETRGELTKAKAEMSALRTKQERAVADLSAASAEKTQMQSELAQRTAEMTELSGALATSESERQRLGREGEVNARQVDDLTREITASKAEVTARLL
jgi:chromosome segregation ATPase